MNEFDELVESAQRWRKIGAGVEEQEGDNYLRNRRQPYWDYRALWKALKKINLTSGQLLKLLPSPVLDLFYSSPSDQPKAAPRSTAWLDGIRGCAALVVFIEHLSLSVQDSHAMLRAYGSPGATSFWQLPIVRLLYDGSPMVPIFYVTSGCALSLQPLSHIYKGEWSEFYATISSATFRRAFRLFLPSAAVSFLAMIFTQLGVYNYPYHFIEGNAIIIDRPQRLPNFAAQYVDWLNWVTTQLLYSQEMFQPLSRTTISNYGFQLWTISTEFYASITLFITLVGLAQLPVSRRQFLVFSICAFAFYLDRWDIACFMAGISITELSMKVKKPNEFARLPLHNPGKSISSWLSATRQYGFALLFVSGLFLASYPYKQASENFIYQGFAAIIDNVRFWESIGAVFILISVSQLVFMKRLLTSAILGYLGRISYGVYLTHVVFLNTFGWRIVPWMWRITGDEGWLQRQGGFAAGLICCLMLLIWIADIWTRAVDEPCVRLAKGIERWASSR
ncbi:acyltransferase family-domain-containing protein [Talaromyces proteolyticus]|uniref:Acyltransferase family-domain-containing protein n=1 Tax=Talaromyces proteolyticus TaxID=1131652 RepID=A0AAD4Q4A9_9EURO|nr:acyltransferase family-domain-containing protein [Talaromyces proteolyticus]KAH8703041.1 acyltransferase family-domain-containing protein [Talaromyces proteolyticus]